LKARHCFDVVIEDIRPTLEDEIERGSLTTAVGNQHFDLHAWHSLANRTDRIGHCSSTFVGKIVTSNSRYDGEVEFHSSDRFGNSRRFLRIKRFGKARINQTKPALSGATLALDHEGCGAVGPAFGKIRASGFFAHRDELKITKCLLQLERTAADIQLRTHPLRFAFHDVDAIGDTGFG
jgi:hypothetical protein